MDSSGLKYSSVDQLQSSCSLTRELTHKLERMSCEEIYKSMKNLLVKAREARGETETQYQHYMRSAELAEIIRNHKNFKGFIRLKAQELCFHTDYKECVTKMGELQLLLNKKYDEQKLRFDKIGRANSNENNSFNNDDSKKNIVRRVRFTISPKDLIRMVEKDTIKKSAIIFDYRKIKDESIYYKQDNLITIIQIPHEMVDSSMIFTKMRQSLDIKQRTLLNRLPTYDFVVLMEEETPELCNGDPKIGTKASIMMKALTEYIGSDYRTKERPMFMEGGFKMWKNQYPTYTVSENAITPRASMKDDLYDTIQRVLRDDTLSRIAYADLSAPKPSQGDHGSSVPSLRDSISSSGSSTPDILIARPQFGVVAGNSLSGPQHLPQRPVPTTFPANVPSAINGAPEKPAATGLSNKIAQQPPIPNIPPQIPFADRANKPTVTTFPAYENPSKEAKAPVLNASKQQPPLLDRGTKPRLITKGLENALITIYTQITDNVSRSGTRRNGSAPGMTGLYNMGNTCFMSATLQCLFHTPKLSDVFTKENFLSKVNPENKMGTKGVISAVFSALMDIVWSGQFQSIRPQRFLHAFADEVNSSLADGQQHDASEFQLFLLDALHEDTNQVIKRISFEQNYKGGTRIAKEADNFTVKNRQFAYSPVNQIFSVLTVSELTCCSCGESSATFEDNTLISVELSNLSTNGQYSLDDCLRSHFSQTRLDGDSRWNCPRCKSAQAAERRTKLWSLPSVLVIHLKRFSLVNGDYVKNTAPVLFETERFDPSNCLHNLAPEDHKATYRLYAVTNHNGRLNSGHYTATAMHLRTNKWLRFDDESVTTSDVTAIDNRAAYILFYKKV